MKKGEARKGRPAALTRRRFVAGSAAAGLAVTAGYWSESAAAAGRSAAEKLNVAAIGVGNRGSVNLASVNTENIVALCDVDQAKLAPQRARYPDAAAYRDFRELLERDDIDAVLVSTPDHTHFHAARLAILRGMHVYCERPLAHSIWEVRQLQALAARAGVATQMGNQHHSSRGYAEVVDWVRSGRLGEVREVHCWTNRPLWPQGIDRPEPEPVPDTLAWDLWLGPAPERPYHSIYHPIRWRGWWDFGGGALADRGPHQLDPAYWALKLTLPSRISAESSPVNSETLPAWSIVRFAFPAVEDRPPVDVTWYDGGKLPPRSVTGTADPPSNGTMLIGSEARLFVPELGKRPIVIPAEGRARPPRPEPTTTAVIDHHAQWLQACRGGPPAGSRFEYGGPLTETCLLGNIAIRTGRHLHWDARRMAFQDDAGANEYLRREYREGWRLPDSP